MKGTQWRNIEREDVETEGYVIVPADGSYCRYASKDTLTLFESETKAQAALTSLERRGRVDAGTYKCVRARLSHHRSIDVLEERLRLIVSE